MESTPRRGLPLIIVILQEEVFTTDFIYLFIFEEAEAPAAVWRLIFASPLVAFQSKNSRKNESLTSLETQGGREGGLRQSPASKAFLPDYS